MYVCVCVRVCVCACVCVCVCVELNNGKVSESMEKNRYKEIQRDEFIVKESRRYNTHRTR